MTRPLHIDGDIQAALTHYRTVFLEQVDISGPCWLWLGKHEKRHGYGYAYNPRRKGRLRAHRMSYLLFIGDLKQGMDVHHTCENTLCVNPLHLVLLIKSEHHEHHVAKIRGVTTGRRSLLPSYPPLVSG